MTSRTISVELDEDDAWRLEYCASERAGGDEALAVRQAVDAYFETIRGENFSAKRRRILEQPPLEIDPDEPVSAEEEAFLSRILGPADQTPPSA